MVLQVTRLKSIQIQNDHIARKTLKQTTLQKYIVVIYLADFVVDNTVTDCTTSFYSKQTRARISYQSESDLAPNDPIIF